MAMNPGTGDHTKGQVTPLSSWLRPMPRGSKSCGSHVCLISRARKVEVSDT